MKRLNIVMPQEWPSLHFLLLTSFFIILFIAGGASRADASGQLAVRTSAWLIVLASLFLRGPICASYARPVFIILLCIAILPILQLVPLPPSLWETLPGHENLKELDQLTGQPAHWRPLSLVPGATFNAANSLIVPTTILLMLNRCSAKERAHIPFVILLLIIASSVIGLLQYSSGGPYNSLVNYFPGAVSGTFANRNHFALFLAMGCVLAPAWALESSSAARWRAPIAIGMVVLFVLLIMACGSRAGLVLALVAIVMAASMGYRSFAGVKSGRPPWLAAALTCGLLALILSFAAVTVFSDQATSLTRLLALSDDDLRARAAPTVWTLMLTYFPVGSGFGGFATIFQVQEPAELLLPPIFNHAHNDIAEILIDGGLLALFVLLATVIWWISAVARIWHQRSIRGATYSKAGSVLLLQIFLASIVDYPARTPLIMAVVAVAATWLAEAGRAS